MNLKDDHEAIVDDETRNAVQARIGKNKELQKTVGHLGGAPHFLYGKVFCEECGAPMKRRTVNDGRGGKQKVWMCRERMKKGNPCKGRIVKETELLKVICGGETQ